MNDTQEIKRSRARGFCKRATAATLTGVGALVIGGSPAFATPTPSEEAGEALVSMGADGTAWVGTYVVVTVAGALGIGLVVALILKYGKRIRSAF